MKRSWIERRLKHLGHSKGELALAMNLPSSRISEILGGRRALKISELNRLANFLELPTCQVADWLTVKSDNPRGLTPKRKSQSVWVVGHQRDDNAQPELWPSDAHYLINLPLPDPSDDQQFYATEVQNGKGQLGGLQVFSSLNALENPAEAEQTYSSSTNPPIGKYTCF